MYSMYFRYDTCPPSNQTSSRDLWQEVRAGAVVLVALALSVALVRWPPFPPLSSSFPSSSPSLPLPSTSRPFPRHRDPSLVALSVFLHRRRRPFSLLSVCLAMALAVPQMPESNLWGTLETRQKRVADTGLKRLSPLRHKIDVSVYALAAGRITELLANEEQYRSGRDLCIPGVRRTVLVEDGTTARICRKRG